MGRLQPIRSASVRHIAAALAVLTAFLIPAQTSAGKPAPRLDTATATGDNLVLDDFSARDIDVNASSGPSGENPTGTGSFNPLGILPITGPVSCLNVQGNVAVLTIDGPFESRPGFLGFSIKLVDNGGGGRDTFQYWPADPEHSDPLDCRVGSVDWFGGPLIGRAVVTDAPALPTLRRQCRHGGWAGFGFRSKKQCFRFVKSHRHAHR